MFRGTAALKWKRLVIGFAVLFSVQEILNFTTFTDLLTSSGN